MQSRDAKGKIGPRDGERIGAIQAKYGLSMDIESIGPLTKEHGLQA
jgi:hypothetical protein